MHRVIDSASAAPNPASVLKVASRRRVRRFAFLPVAILASPSLAAQSDWLEGSQVEPFLLANLAGGKAYPSGIACKDDPESRDPQEMLIKIFYESYPAPAEITKWTWAFGGAASVQEATKRFQGMGYRVASRDAYTETASGDARHCVIFWK